MLHSYGKIQRKILLLLLAGVALGITRSPSKQWKIVKELAKEWKEIDRRSIQQAINSLYKSNLVSRINNTDGTTTVILNKKGKKLALTYNLQKMTLLQPKRWNKKWWIVMFDIPEKYKNARDTFRFYLKRLGFLEYQKSVFITPYPCAREVEYLREFWGVKPFVRVLLVDRLDNEIHLKQHFGLIY